MPGPRSSPTRTIRSAWQRLRDLPGGKGTFSRLLGFLVPYTGSIRPRVLELRAGYALVEMRDRRAVRNHLRSVHAIALANLGEVTSGLAMTLALPDDARAIVIGFEVEYVKKARGVLTAECTCEVASVTRSGDHEVESVIRDPMGEVVARTRALWRIDSNDRSVQPS
ncbi:MAG TPA: hotdog fold domain-containing protein [Gemmatimonadaceae bacterium]|nr:hotdog fold domain-containing protein [Gemmatimonadaceae bacterium]